MQAFKQIWRYLHEILLLTFYWAFGRAELGYCCCDKFLTTLFLVFVYSSLRKRKSQVLKRI